MRLSLPSVLLAVSVFAAELRAHSGAVGAIIELTDQIAAEGPTPALLLRRADRFEEHGDAGLAEADLKQAALLEPESPEVALQLAAFLVGHRRMAEANKPLSTVLSRQPANPAALILRARLLATMDDPTRAYADFTRAITLLPEPRPELYLERASLSLDPAQLLSGLDEGLARLGPVVALVERALALELTLGHLEPALARLDALAASSERQEKFLKRRGDLLASAGRHTAARQAYQAALAALDRLPAWLGESSDCRQLKAELHSLLPSTPLSSP